MQLEDLSVPALPPEQLYTTLRGALDAIRQFVDFMVAREGVGPYKADADTATVGASAVTSAPCDTCRATPRHSLPPGAARSSSPTPFASRPPWYRCLIFRLCFYNNQVADTCAEHYYTTITTEQYIISLRS